ncbi:hypothetical protein JNW90_07380 [Micromonospora sp. STR1s_5]|nr:hypothetical protein [Micromonospora sp. STR1s_5]
MSDREDVDESVGYKRPPKRTRFTKGQSGNPKGRAPKTKNLDTLVLNELDRKVTVSEGGRERVVSKREAIAIRLVNGALKGNPRQLEFLFRYMRELGLPDPFVFSEVDDANLAASLSLLLQGRPTARKDQPNSGESDQSGKGATDADSE